MPSLCNYRVSFSRKLLIDSSFVRSISEYYAPLFLSISARDFCRLEHLQRRFHRTTYVALTVNRTLSPLQETRFMLSMIIFSALLSNDHILYHLLPIRSSSSRFILHARRTACRNNSFFLYACDERFNLSVLNA